MKFWKLSLLTTLLFFVVAGSVLYSACEKDPCNNVTCQNGGSCNSGVCRCPLGYENTKCETKSITRYLGTYAGYTTCNNGVLEFDTAWITPDNGAINTVQVKLKSIQPRMLYGYVTSNESTYSIVVTNNDSTQNLANIYTITLQNDKLLSIHGYTLSNRPQDTTVNKCTFLSNKKY